VGNEKNWDEYECAEGSDRFNQCKTLMMVVNKKSTFNYHPNLEERKKKLHTTSIPYNYVFTIDLNFMKTCQAIISMFVLNPNLIDIISSTTMM
jgi:hypothetical protein